jgi:hypothetical protein
VESLRDIVERVVEALKQRFAELRSHGPVLAILVPLAFVAIAAGGYGLWWRTIADNVRDRVMALQAKQKLLGREVSWDSFAVAGFPYRVETTIGAVHFTAPDRGSAWDGERVVVTVPPLAADRLTISLEGQQHYFYAREQWIETNATADKALVTLSSGAEGRQRVEVAIRKLTGKAKLDANDFNFIVDEASGGVLLVPEKGARKAPPDVEVTAKLENVALQGGFDLPLGPAIQTIDVAAGLKLPPGVTEPSLPVLLGALRRSGAPIALKRFQVNWGGVSVEGSGTFKLDENSLPDGTFFLKLGNHPRILELLEGHGWISAETRASAKKVLDVFAFMSGDKQRRVPVPLRIEKGVVYAGPAKIATLLPQPTASAAQFAPPDAPAP